MIDLGSWVGSLATIGVPDVAGRVLASPFDLRFDPAQPPPLRIPPFDLRFDLAQLEGPSVTFGTVTEAWISDDVTLMASGRLVVDDEVEQLAEVMIDAMRSGALVPGFELRLLDGDQFEAGRPIRIAAGELGPVYLRPSFLASWPICRFEVQA